MSSGQRNIHSQGCNFGSFIQKGVDPRTGQYTCGITIYESPSEARNCPPLKLSLSYNSLVPQDIGLGAGWSFNLSGYQHRQSNNRTLFLSTGEHYQVTETSDLVTVKDQKLRNFQFTKTATGCNGGNETPTYQITYKSGLMEILSNANNSFDTTVPVELCAENGRSLKLGWTTYGEQPRLSKIQEGGQDLLTIDYTDAQVNVVRNPNTAEASTLSLVRANDQLVEVRLPLEEREERRAAWIFTYETFDQSIACLSTVASPVGLLEEVQYKQDGHRLPGGAPYESIPYAISYTMRPGSQQPPIETRYSFSDRNFLGYNGCNDWKDGEDNLYRVPDEYQYTSTVQVEGGTQTKYTYNKFHLMVNTQQQRGTKQVTQNTTYYALLEKAFDDQPAQYLLPRCIQTTYRDTATGASRVQTSQYVFDEWGNPIQEIAANGTKTDRLYYLAAGERDAETSQVYCPADPNGFRRYLKEEVVTPAASLFATPTRSERCTYKQLPTATDGCPTNWLVVVQQMEVLENSQCVTSTQFAFVNQPAARDHGRVQETITLLPGQHLTTRNWTYRYPGDEQLLETISTKFFDGLTVQDETGYSLFSGRALSQKDVAGNQSLLTYDTLGRQVKLTTSPGTSYEATQQRDYTVLRDDDGDPVGCRITVADAKGVKIRYSTDGLERVLQTERQDDDGRFSASGNDKLYSGTFRLVQERCHNAQNQCIQVVDIDWLTGAKARDTPTEQRSTRSFKYDDWGQMCSVTEDSGVVTWVLADPISLTRVEGIEGEGKFKTRLDVSGSPTQRELLRNDGSLVSKEEYAYDGLGRLIKQIDQSGHTKQLSYDCFDRITQTTWPDGHSTNAQYAAHSAAALPTKLGVGHDSPFAEQAFDGFDRLVKRRISSRTTKQSYQGSEPEPTEVMTPKGDEHHLTYNPALNHVLTSTTSSDTAYTYQYDTETAAVKQLKGVNSTHDRHYLPSGMLSAESITDGGETSTAQSIYSMAGRLESYTDISGQKHEIQYDSFGRPQQLAQGKLNVIFSYDKAGRLSEGCVKDEENNSSLATRLEYDDFGREIRRTAVQKGDSEKALHQLSQTYGELGLVATRDVRDGEGNLLRHESFQYDNLNRLVDYQSKGSDSWLPADEEGNRLQHQQFTFDNYNSLTQVATVFQDGSGNTTCYTYSDQDHAQVIKITNTHPDYSPQINLAYNANGCLTRDEQGRVLEYDTMNRLIAVRDASDSSQVLSRYQYDATGKLVHQMVPGQPDTHLSYRGDMLVAVTVGDSRVTYACLGNVYWGQTTTTTATTMTATTSLASSGEGNDQETSQSRELWTSDFHQSVLGSLAAGGDFLHQQYTPYGFGTARTSIGFNGQWRDPVTGLYHLGNGYRVYSPVLMRFYTPDAWSPFISGEINAYAYCLGDPVNLTDPSGHLSIFGIPLGDRDLVMMGVGIGVGILVGILTGGASLAIAAGLSVAASVASDVATGAIYDLVSGKSPTWESVGTDALYGAIGGLVGEGIGRVVGKGIRALSQTVGRALGHSAPLAMTELAERQPGRAKDG
ncbi:hypothetical protein B0H67DRAFT_610844 [Lasiosphaeris hirsuta]|uniref:Uncharacterized protein n=1 Tax=Lasiosphaeris hirsuta TaxID=260670 RepID=A0AA40AI76_9PEZI|nr:hypothetical protein B0H67DRAFT_610844 [Lasiosphaeris hirsuta]